jgi:hypothetical protein
VTPPLSFPPCSDNFECFECHFGTSTDWWFPGCEWPLGYPFHFILSLYWHVMFSSDLEAIYPNFKFSMPVWVLVQMLFHSIVVLTWTLCFTMRLAFRRWVWVQDIPFQSLFLFWHFIVFVFWSFPDCNYLLCFPFHPIPVLKKKGVHSYFVTSSRWVQVIPSSYLSS